MPPSKNSLVVVGFADSDIQAHLFTDKSIKVSSVTVELGLKNEGAPREIGHAIRVVPTAIELPLKPDGTHPTRRDPKVVVYPDGTVWVDPSVRRKFR